MDYCDNETMCREGLGGVQAQGRPAERPRAGADAGAARAGRDPARLPAFRGLQHRDPDDQERGHGPRLLRQAAAAGAREVGPRLRRAARAEAPEHRRRRGEFLRLGLLVLRRRRDEGEVRGRHRTGAAVLPARSGARRPLPAISHPPSTASNFATRRRQPGRRVFYCWHPDVRFWRTYDVATGEMLGELYVDLHPRPQDGHAAHWGLGQHKVWLDGTLTKPLARPPVQLHETDAGQAVAAVARRGDHAVPRVRPLPAHRPQHRRTTGSSPARASSATSSSCRRRCSRTGVGSGVLKIFARHYAPARSSPTICCRA